MYAHSKKTSGNGQKSFVCRNTMPDSGAVRFSWEKVYKSADNRPALSWRTVRPGDRNLSARNVRGGYQTKIRKIEFRKKKRGWCCSNIDIELDDGFYFGNFDNDWFEKAYHNNLCLRDSCYECKFCTFPRTGDLSIGDFWEADTCEQLKNDAKGTSVVFVNSKLGKTVLDMQRDSFVLFHKIKQEDLYKNRIQANIERHPGRTRFFDLLKKYPFTKSAEYAMQHKYDVVVIGIPTVENHGSNLTYYALYRALKNMGMEVLMAERPLSAQWQPHKVPIGFCKNPYPDQDWCELFQSKYEMQKLNEYAEVFLLGSDQLWYEGLYECFDGFCFLDYIYQNKKKAAYAASFGRDVYSGTSNQRARIQYFLQRFDNISVREQEAVALCQKDFGVETTCVLDPVFLCPSAEYLELIKNAGEQGNTGHKIVTYILDPTQEKEEIVSYIAGRLMLPVIHMTDVINVDEKQDRWTEEFLKNVSNERWLKNIYESDFFITDSFHGTCFGIIFKKQFVAIGNAYRGMARFHTILSKCGLQSRLVLEYDPQQLEQMLYELIDYECVDKKLKPEIEKSRQWLIHAVAEKEQCAVSTYDMLQQQMLQLYHRLMECRDHADAHGNVIGAHDVRMQAYDTAFKNLFQEIAVHQKVLLEQRQTAEALQKVLAEQEEKLERFQNKCLEQEQWIESHQYPLSGFRDKSGTDLL